MLTQALPAEQLPALSPGRMAILIRPPVLLPEFVAPGPISARLRPRPLATELFPGEAAAAAHENQVGSERATAGDAVGDPVLARTEAAVPHERQVGAPSAAVFSCVGDHVDTRSRNSIADEREVQAVCAAVVGLILNKAVPGACARSGLGAIADEGQVDGARTALHTRVFCPAQTSSSSSCSP